MKALILNSGLGSRMGRITEHSPKCLTKLTDEDTILSRQLRLLSYEGISDVIVTTGYYDKEIESYCESLHLPINYTFVKNPIYDKTNYIYSIYCARENLDDDLILMHGDLVFEASVLHEITVSETSVMKVSSVLDLPQKDFKAIIDSGVIVSRQLRVPAHNKTLHFCRA